MRHEKSDESKNILKVIIIIAVIVALFLLACGALLLCERFLEPRISIDGTSLVIKDTYPKTADLSGSAVALEEGKLPLAKRTGGTAIGDVRKGNYTLDDGSAVYLSITNYGGKYIKIVQADGYTLYVGRKDDSATEVLFAQIAAVSGVTVPGEESGT